MFTASVYGTADARVTWSVAEGAPGGTVDANGAYVAPANAGSVSVVATSVADPTKAASAAVTVENRPTVDLGVSPAEASVLPGGTVQLSTTSSTGGTVAWTAIGGGTVSSTGLYTAPHAPGTYLVVASSTASTTSTTESLSTTTASTSLRTGIRGNGRSKITVTSPAVAVTVTPSSASVQAGGSLALSAAVANATNTSVTWSVKEGASGGSVTSAGVYTAPAAAGTYHVVATSVAAPTASATSTISVSSPPPPAPVVSVSVAPSAAAIRVGDTVSFTATVANATNTAVTWSVQEAGGGSVSASGAYTAPSTAGTYHVVATSVADATKRATATVTVSAPPVAVSVSPITASVSTGATIAFASSVANSSNQAVTWSVQEGTAGGSVTSAGVYTAPSSAGTYHVVATSQADPTKSATAAVTVNAPLPVSVAVAPATAALSAGGTQAFTATVTSSSNQTVTWIVQEGAAGGAVTSTGVYTAPSTSGTYHVVATSQADTTKSATATVTVTAPTAGADYYVSPSGSGTACSAASPCSLSTAMSQLNGLGSNAARSGKAVQLAAGDYAPFSLGAGQSGPDANHRVVLRADPNASSPVRILGGTKVTSWGQCTSTSCSAVWSSLPTAAKSGGPGGGSHVYRASISSIGSYPTDLTGDSRGWWATDSYSPCGGDGKPSAPTMLLSATPPAGYCTNGYYNGRLCPLAAVLARYPNRDSAGRDQWVTSWGGRDYTGSGAVIQSIMNAYASQASPFGTGVDISQGAYVLNAVQELDSAGEYWIDRTSGVAYFWPWVDGDPSTNGGEVVVGTSAGPILDFASGSQYVEVKGVTVEGGQTHCVAIAGAGNQLTSATVRNCAGNDVRMGGTNNTISGGKFSNAGNDAIVYTTLNGETVSGGTVTNAEITEWGLYRITYARAVLIGADGLRVSHNKMYSGSGPCVTFEGKNSTIEYNDMSRCPLNGNDNGSIYAWASNSVSVGTTIRYNYFHDIPSSSNVPGAFSSPDVVIYQDDNINGVSNYGNIMYGIGHNTGTQYDNTGFPRMGSMSKGANTFANNVLANVDGWNGNSAMYFVGGSSTGSNNLFVNSAYGYNASRGTDVTALPIAGGSGTAAFANVGSATRDLSNNTCGGARCFTSGAFTTDPNGLSYIPWSQIGIQ